MELNKIYCEDCLETMARMPDNFVDLTVTSPPYDNLRTYNDNIDKTWNLEVFKKIASELFRVTKEGGVVVWVVGDATINGSETGTSFKQALYFMECGFNLHDTMIYQKNGCSNPEQTRYYNDWEYMFVFSNKKPKSINLINDRRNKYINGSWGDKTRYGKDGKKVKAKRYSSDLFGIRFNRWRYNVGFGFNTKDKNNHPAIFPEDLAKDHIYSWSNEGDLVYDPFMGSGTTAKMAHIYKRNWIGSEISQEYVDLANKRLKPYLTQTTLF